MKVLFDRLSRRQNLRTEKHMIFLQERYQTYVTKQLLRPSNQRNRIPQKPNVFDTILRFIGILPIKPSNFRG